MAKQKYMEAREKRREGLEVNKEGTRQIFL
jgi:hypothetical protein